MRTLARLVAFAVFAVVVSARTARADPWFGFGADTVEDRFADGDLDEEDIASLPAFGRGVGSSDARGRTWLSLLGSISDFPNGAHEVTVGIVLGVAFDKVAQGSVHVARDRSRSFLGDGPSPAPTPLHATLSPILDAPLARGAVRAGWRVAGVEVTDARVDEMIARARRSAALPEVRLRALRVLNSGEDVTYVDSAGRVYNTVGANLSLEARLTWRLDRLIFSDDEPTLERVRLERQEARGRLGTHILELLFGWQRALFDIASSTFGTRAELEAILKKCETEIALDVLTGGWFGVQPAVRSASNARGGGS